MANLYTTGGTVRPDSPGYIERAADGELYEALRAGEFCHVLDSRQKGKSSLMTRCQLRLEAEGIRSVHLDLQRFGSNLDSERWYAGLLDGLGEALDVGPELFAYWGSHLHFGPLQRFFGAIEHVLLDPKRPLAIFIDEIDFVRSLPFSTDELFAGIRGCYNRRSTDPRFESLTFCLVGVATPSELIRDIRITPFNIGKRIELTDFTLAESAPLAAGLGTNGTGLLQRIHYWAGGHPYLTQKLCAAAAAAHVATTTDIDQVVAANFFAAKARQEEPNLSDVSRRLLESQPSGQSKDEYLSEILDLYKKVRSGRRIVRDDETDPLIALLKLTGVTTAVDGYLLLRNRIYERVFDRQWILANMPVGELQRQRAAATTAVLKTSLVAAIVLAAVAALAYRNSNLVYQRSLELAKSTQLALQNGELVEKAGKALQKAKASEAEARTRAAEANLNVKKAIDAGKVAQKAVQALRSAVAGKQAALGQAQQAQANALRAAGQERIATLSAQEQADLAKRTSYDANMSLLERDWEASTMPQFYSLLDATGTSPYRGFEWNYWWRAAHKEEALLPIPLGSRGVRFSRDGRHIVALEPLFGCLKVWGASSWKLERVIPIDSSAGALQSFALSWDSKLVAVQTGSSGVLVISLATGKTRFAIPAEANRLAFAKDGSRLIASDFVGSPGKFHVQAWDLATHRLVQDFNTGAVSAISEDGSVCITRTKGNGPEWRVWSVQSGQNLSSIDIGWRSLAELSPDGKEVVTTDGTGVLAYDTARGAELYRVSISNVEPRSVTFSPDGKLFALSCSDAKIVVVDSVLGTVLATIRGPSNGAEVAFTTDDRHLLSTRGPGEFYPARLWRLAPRDEAGLATSGLGPGLAAVFSSDGKLLAAATAPNEQGGAGKVAIWSTGSRSLLKALPLRALALRFGNDGQTLAVAEEHRISFWSIRTGAMLRAIKNPLPTGFQAAFSSDGTACAYADRADEVAMIHLASGATAWRTGDLRNRIRWTGRYGWDGEVDLLSISPDDRQIVVGLRAGVLHLVLNSATGAILGGTSGFSQDHYRRIAWSGDEVASSGYGSFGAYGISVSNSVLQDSPTVVTSHQDLIEALVFSPDGGRLLSGSDDGSVRALDLKTEREVGAFTPGLGPISAMAISRDGANLAVFGQSGAQLWKIGAVPNLAQLESHYATVEDYNFLADARLREGDLDGALDAAKSALSLAPDDLAILNMAGQVYQARKDFRNAALCYERAVTHTGVGPETHFNYAQVLLALGKRPQAIDQFTIADLQDSRNVFRRLAADTLKKLGRVTATDRWSSAGELAVANRDWKTALGLLKNPPPSFRGNRELPTLLAIARMLGGERGIVQQEYRTFLQNPRWSPETVLFWGRVARIVPDGGLDLGPIIEEAERLGGDETVEESSAPGAILFRAGRYQDAIARLDKALRANGEDNNPYTRLFRAMALQKLGPTDEAKDELSSVEDFQRGPRMNPEWYSQIEFWALLDEARRAVRSR